MTLYPTSFLSVVAFKILNLVVACRGCHQVFPAFGLLIQFRMSQNPVKEIKDKSRIQYIVLAVVQWLSHVRLFLTTRTSARQASRPSPSPWACSNSCPLSRWCHPTISSSVVPSSSFSYNRRSQIFFLIVFLIKGKFLTYLGHSLLKDAEHKKKKWLTNL